MKRITLPIIGLSLLTSSCATIVGDKTQFLPIHSKPDNATISIVDEKGKEVYNGLTPATVELDKSDGTYWGGKKYEVTI